MNESFKKLILYSEKKLSDKLAAGDIAGFSDELPKLYPLVIKFYPKDTEKCLSSSGFSKLFEKIKKTALDTAAECLGYEVQSTKIVLTKKTGETLEYPILNPNDFVKNGMSLSPDKFGFFLTLSFLVSPMNYDMLQLFGVTLRSKG